MPKVEVPPRYRGPTGGLGLIEVDAETLEPIAGSRRSSLDMKSSHILIHSLG